MELLWFLLIGLVAGWLAGEIARCSSFGIFGNVTIGLLGALNGGFLLSIIGIDSIGVSFSLIMSVMGAIILLYLINYRYGRHT